MTAVGGRARNWSLVSVFPSTSMVVRLRIGDAPTGARGVAAWGGAGVLGGSVFCVLSWLESVILGLPAAGEVCAAASVAEITRTELIHPEIFLKLGILLSPDSATS